MICNEYGSFQSFARCLFQWGLIWTNLGYQFVLQCTGSYRQIELVQQSTAGIVLCAKPISIIHLIPVSDFSQSHLECYMKSVADVLIFLTILVLRNNIKIPPDSHPTSQLNLNTDGHYQVIPVDDSHRIISYLCFCHWFLSSCTL